MNMCALSIDALLSALDDDVAFADSVGAACLGLEDAHQDLVSL